MSSFLCLKIHRSDMHLRCVIADMTLQPLPIDDVMAFLQKSNLSKTKLIKTACDNVFFNKFSGRDVY